MNMMAVSLTALSLATFCSLPADAQQRREPYRPGAGSAAPRMVIAQGEVRIPSDAQLERMEERAVTTPPLDVREAPRTRGRGEEAEIRQMDERARRIDEQLLGSGAICTDCK
jgi:hypothetical protein